MTQNLNKMKIALITADVVCWAALVFLGFKWVTCTCGA